MNKAKNISKNIKAEKLLIYFKDFSTENILVTLLLCLAVLVLSGNILRVISTARSNYEIFSIETQSLNDLKKKNADLLSELEYVSSDEYKMLLLRNSANMAQSGEELYTIKDKAKYLDEELRLLDLSKKSNFNNWWQMLSSYIFN